MSIIYSYPEQEALNPNDMLVGTSTKVVGGKQKNITRNFSIQQISDYINDGGTVFNPAATDFQIAVFNQGGTRLTGSIISQNTFPNGTFVTIAGNLTANAATLNEFLTLNGGANLGSGALGELITIGSLTRFNAPIQDQLGVQGGLGQILVSNSAGRVSWENYNAGLIYSGTWDALNNTTAPQGAPLTNNSGTNGEFYIVAVAGNTQLNGQPAAPTTPPYWQPGDWVVRVESGNVDAWQKVDNSSVLTGTGTDNKIAMWTGGANPSVTLTDSLISQDSPATTVTITGALTTTGNVNAGGSVIATANVSGVNLNASGNVVATGNVSGVDVTASGNVSAVNVTASSDVSAVNVTATTTVTPTTITDKDAGVGANGQILSSTVTGVEWIDNQVGTVTGTGTTSTLPIWSDGTAGVLGNSVITQVAGGLAPSTDPADTLSGLFTNIGGASTTYDIGAIGSTFNENLFSTLNLTQFAAGDQVEISNGTSSFRLTLVAQGTILGGVNGTVISGTQTGFAVNGLTGTITLLVAVAARITIAGDATVNGDFSTQGLEVNKYLTDGAGNKGTDGQVLTSTTVGGDKEIVWTTSTVGTVTNFAATSTITGITTAVTNPTTTPTLTLSITGTPGASLFLDGTGNWSSPGGGVTDITATAPLSADTATGSVTLSMPAYVTATGGYVPSGGATGQYLDGLSGSWTTLPAGDTYTLGSSTDGSNVKLNLDAASGTDSAITLTGAGGLTVAQTNNIVTLTAPAGSDTTYTLAAGAKSGSNVPLNLSPSTGSDTTVNLTDGTGITLTRNAANQVTISTTAAIGNFLPLAGGTMTGVISMGNDKITNVDDPTSPQDAATKQYVDDSVVGGLIYQGGYNASTNSPVLDSRGSQIAVSKGWTYTVTTDGTFYTETVKIGDVLIAEVDIAAGTGALTDWTTVQSNIDVASATVQGIANFPSGGNNQLNIATGSVTAKTFGDGTLATSITGGYVPNATSAATGTFLSKTGSWLIPPNTGGTVTSVGLSSNVAAFTVSPTPVTGSGVLTLNRNGGTTGQYIDGATGAWTTLPAPGTGTVTGTGAATQVAFWDAASNINGDTAFNWDNTNKRLGIGTTSPGVNLEINDANTPKIRFGRGGSYYWDIGQTISDFQIQSQTGGTIMHLEFDGNVGIGTTSPNYKLHVKETTTAAKMYINGENGGVTSSLLIGRDARNWEIKTDTAANIYRYSLSYVGTDTPVPDIFTALANGNVGVGTDTPGYLLDVSKSNIGGTTDMRVHNEATTTNANSGARSIISVANANVGDPRLVLAVTGVREYSIGIDNSDGDKFKINSGSDPSAGSNYLTIDPANSNVGIGTTVPSNKLSLSGNGQGWVDSPGIKIWDTHNSKGWYVGSANNSDPGDFYIRAVTAESAYPAAANKQFTIKQSGNVGIGTITPLAGLHVRDASQTSSITDTVPSWWSAIFERSYSSPSNAAVGLIGGPESGGAGGALYLGYSDDVDNNYLLIDSNDMFFGVNGGNRMCITSAGGISFGSTGTAYGTSGQVLTSNGNASPTWQPGGGTITKQLFPVGATATTAFPLTSGINPADINYVNIFIDGVYQNSGTYTVSTTGTNTTVTLGTSVSNVSVEIVSTT